MLEKTKLQISILKFWVLIIKFLADEEGSIINNLPPYLPHFVQSFNSFCNHKLKIGLTMDYTYIQPILFQV